MKPGQFPTLSIGSAANIARDRLQPEVINIAVRVEDRASFLGIIDARERQLTAGASPFVRMDNPAAQLTGLTADAALGAADAMNGSKPDKARAIARLEHTAAMAIAALNQLKGEM
ncbi:MAG: hypothetical protein GW859_05385 [Sphingomonadales bacterium]|nr:hypothetical protein [Sphingomonadales bacterium]